MQSRFMAIIRPYKDSDFEDYAGTLLQTWPFKNIQEARENVAEGVKRAEAKGEEIWVAEVDGTAAGFIIIEFTKDWSDGGESFKDETVCIDWFDVNPKFQQKGIGKELLLKAEERGRERGLHQISMNTSIKNVQMMNFASKNGFKS
ncbi:MAG: GNAT family N-acetyltransferase, partial [Candidatus Micrarchaeales archaeon]